MSRLKQTAWKQRSRWQLRSLLRRTGKTFDLPPIHSAAVPKDASGITAACILDDFSYRAFQDEMHLVPVREDTWPEAFRQPIDMLLVEAFWRGSGGSWRGIAYDYNVKERELVKRIARWCRQGGIPTVFWNKEDPVHFDEFVDIAVEFDHVLTTDAGCIERYARRGKKAEVLQFAAQPSIHNPIEICPQRTDKVCFAGSYIRTYPQRMRDFDMMVEAIGEGNLDIYDRNLERNDPRYAFPERYAPLVKGTLKGDEIVRAYKGYRYGLNMNSVKGSETMLARRVFELMASNTPVISNASKAIDSTFPGLVLASDDVEAIRSGLDQLRRDEGAYRKRRAQALRAVMGEHTYRDRAGQIFKLVFKADATEKLRPVRCVARHGDDDAVQRSFRLQSYGEKELAFFKDEAELAGLLRDSITAGQLVALLRPTDHYGPFYLNDMALAFFYSDAAVVTKLSHFRGGSNLGGDGHQYRWVEQVRPAVMIDPSRLSAEDAIGLLARGAIISSGKCLSVDEFNYVEDLPAKDDVPYSDG